MAISNRRSFLALAACGPALARSSLAANDRIRVAVIGLRGRGRDLIRAFHNLAQQNVEIAALCDVDESVLRERVADYEKLSGRKVLACDDMRRVFDDRNIDAVAFATPNHWHALGTIWACQAGKDVYVEKPGSHNIGEGRKIVEAARKYNRIVQHGTQNRSSPEIVEAIQKLKEGVIGRVYLARGIAYKRRGSIGRIREEPVPSGLNWDAWQGPAPYRPYSRVRHRGWHLLFDYGNGDIGNQGVHELDIIRWALDLDRHPSKVAAMGGTYIYKDDQQYPQVHAAMYEWPGRDVLVTFETRSGYTNSEAGMGLEFPFLDKRNAVGVIFVGTEGYMILPDYTSYYTFLGSRQEPGPSAPGGLGQQAVPRARGPWRAGAGDIATQPHVDNFIRAVRSRKPADLTAGPEELHLSSTLAHLANIAWRVGRMLHFDPRTERFLGDEEANRYLSREYRPPYVVPEKV
jgi:predicted dehydrogenase